MNDLTQAIEDAYQSPDNESLTNKAHRLFLNHTFILPVKKVINKGDEPTALFFSESNNHFLPVFSSDDFFRQWAGETQSEMDWLNIAGKDLILGSGGTTFLCLDIGQEHYKEMQPDEVIKLKQVISKLERIAKSTSKA